MAYSIDLRKRVVEFVQEGGTKTEAAKRFKVSRWCVYDWINRGDDLKAAQPGPKDSWKLDRNLLKNVLHNKPDASLDELSQDVGTGRTAVWHALKLMKINRKKNLVLSRKG